MKAFFAEFKKFITRGNVLDMAVGVVVGSAFTAIVNSLVKDILNPIIGLVTGGVDFSDLKIVLKPATEEVAELAIRYGVFINAIIQFLLIAFVLFLIVKSFNKLNEKKKKEEEAKKKKISSLLPTLTSVLVVSIKSIASTSEALELRGYGRNNKRTSYRSLKSVKKVFPHFVISVIVPAIIGISLLYWR